MLPHLPQPYHLFILLFHLFVIAHRYLLTIHHCLQLRAPVRLSILLPVIILLYSMSLSLHTSPFFVTVYNSLRHLIIGALLFFLFFHTPPLTVPFPPQNQVRLAGDNLRIQVQFICRAWLRESHAPLRFSSI